MCLSISRGEITLPDFKSIIEGKKYDFLRIDPRLGKNIILLGVSGSYGYGTNREGSDIDLRGIALNGRADLLGLDSFEQFEDRITDTVIFSFMKIIGLLMNCNPNTIEILGLDDDQYVIKSVMGQELLDNKALFLSKRAAASFGHYAGSQLRRLQNAIARDSLTQSEREKHILNSVNNALNDFNDRHKSYNGSTIRLYIDDAVTDGFDTEIFVDGEFRHYPLRQYNEMINTLTNVIRDYSKIGERNKKKDDRHLNKHAMHLIRLFMMGINILEKGEIKTRMKGDDLKLLLDIRDGKYMSESKLIPEFFEIVGDFERRFEEAADRSCLPSEPDKEAIAELVESFNYRAVTGDIR